VTGLGDILVVEFTCVATEDKDGSEKWTDPRRVHGYTVPDSKGGVLLCPAVTAAGIFCKSG
jgi:hypothetical protein